MQSCLGIYIDNSMIKYSKISKEKENIKIESSGVRFYENISATLNQIIQETNSQKLPIAVNVSNENYDYIDVFSLLNKSDIKKSIDIEFEMLCNERGYDKKLFENRYFLSVNRNNTDKMRALNVSVMKNSLIERTRPFDKLKLTCASPISTSVINLLDMTSKPNAMIVNIEETTTVTIIMNGVIEDVIKITDGMKDILEKISESENSLAKAYEICKNTTISTQETGVNESDEYLEVIMPTIYKIVNEVKRIEEGIVGKVDNIYLTGSGIAINNIDLYFQNYFENVHCEMLKPSFLKTGSLKFPLKEYMEVNSATALAIEGAASTMPELNFKTGSSTNIHGTKKNIGKLEVTGIPELKIPNIGVSSSSKNEEEWDSKEKLMFRILATILIFTLGYMMISGLVKRDLVKANESIASETVNVGKAVADINSDIESLQSASDDYKEKYNRLIGVEPETTENEIMKGAIPIFLQQVMYVVPSEVILVSIENTSGNQISIVAKSQDYEQLGLFKAMLYAEPILTNVTSTSSYKEDKDIYVTIIGNLPK